MDKFKVLPTDESFQKLTDFQLAFIIESMSADVDEANNKNLEDEEEFKDGTGLLDGEDWDKVELPEMSEYEAESFEKQMAEIRRKAGFDSSDDEDEIINDEDFMKQRAIQTQKEALASLGISDDEDLNNDYEEESKKAFEHAMKMREKAFQELGISDNPGGVIEDDDDDFTPL